MSVVIGVDVGGTFTDLVLRDQASGEVTIGKAPTTPDAPEEGVLAAVDAVVSADQLARCAWFMHGTTVGLNAIIERRGAVVGLITTRGFRDVLEIGHGDRPDPYDLQPLPADPLVPRRLRAEVAERTLADGTILHPLDVSALPGILAAFAAEGVNAVAVVLINSYANSAHEDRIESALRELGFTGDISVSHRVSGEYREYDRTTTTVIDAFVRHRMGPYLARLQEGLAARGFTGQLLVTRSGGGALTVDEAIARPFETILSGPVAGAASTARLAQSLALPLAVPADVGGTSFDTALIGDGRLPLLFQGEVAGLPLQCPWVDVRSVGAGGGSLAFVDEGGLLRVGPRSAGAVPGPACYGRGGTQATVTDAALTLGLLDAGALSGGVALDREAAHRALDALVGPSGLPDRTAVAAGVLRIAALHMAEAVRGVTIERGVDPRDAALVAFGGAGPLFASLLAEELGSRLVVVPSNAGNFSAVGLMQSDITRGAARTLLRPWGEAALIEVRAAAESLLSGYGEVAERDRQELLLDLRYSGQEHSLTIAAPGMTFTVEQMHALFSAEYERSFGHRLPDPLELVSVRVQRHTALAVDHEAVPAPAWRPPTGSAAARPMWSFTRGTWVEAPVMARSDVPENTLPGPVLVLEQTSTTVVDAGFTVRSGPQSTLLVERTSEGTRP